MYRWLSVFVGIAMVAGLTLGYQYYMKSYAQSVSTMVTYLPVEMIHAGEVIEEKHIRQVTIPISRNLATAISKKEDIVGKRALIPIGESEQFLPWKLTSDDVVPKEGEQLISFPIQYVEAVNNMVRRGDRVNVWVEYAQPKVVIKNGDGSVTEVPKEKWGDPAILVLPNVDKLYAEEILGDLRVAYVKSADGKEVVEQKVSQTQPKGQVISSSQRDISNADSFRSKPSAMPGFITFIVTPDQYVKLARAKSEGIIKLGMEYPFLEIGK